MCAIFNRIAGQNGQHTLIIYNLLIRILVYKTWELCPAQNRVRLIMMMKMNENVIDKYTSLSSQLWSLMQKQIPLFSRQKIIEWIISDTSRLPLFSVPFTCTSVVFSFNLLIHSSSRYSFHFMLFFCYDFKEWRLMSGMKWIQGSLVRRLTFKFLPHKLFLPQLISYHVLCYDASHYCLIDLKATSLWVPKLDHVKEVCCCNHEIYTNHLIESERLLVENETEATC